MYELSIILSYKTEGQKWTLRLCIVKSKILSISSLNSYEEIEKNKKKQILFSPETKVERIFFEDDKSKDQMIFITDKDCKIFPQRK